MTQSPELAQARLDQQHLILRVALPFAAAVYLVLAVAHLLVLPEGVAMPMAVLSVATGLLFSAIAVATRRLTAPKHTTATTALMMVLATVNGTAHLALTGDAYQTTNLILIVVGASALVVSQAVFAAALGFTAGGFAVSFANHAPDPLWVHFAFAVAMSGMLSLAIFRSQRAAFTRRFDAERARDQAELERRVQASELLAHEQRYRLMVANTPVATIVHHNGSIVFANRAAAEISGSGRPEDLIGSRFFDLIEPKDLERVRSWHEAALAELESDALECRLRSLGEHWPLVNLSASAIRWDGVPAGLVTLADASAGHVDVRRLDEEMPAWKAALREPVTAAQKAMKDGRNDDLSMQLTVLSRLLGPAE
ncbi:MAG: PAS domain S-box protein [Proteobacteria bacterium]|nr:PAS domain S-box protein [Pseudomonadota bacterium]